MQIRTLRHRDHAQIISMLGAQWNLASRSARAPHELCAKIYLCDILGHSTRLYVAADGPRVLGVCGFDTPRNLFRKWRYSRKMRRLMQSKQIKNPAALREYYNSYNNFIPPEIRNNYDCELSILIVAKDAQHGGIGTALFNKICADLKSLGYKKFRIDTDDYKSPAYPNGTRPHLFYEKMGATQVYKTPNNSGECPNETLYTYEKTL